MKKVSIIGLILISILLQGCGSEPAYPFSQPFENIERIDIIEASSYKFTPRNQLCNLDAIVTVERDQWSDFISDLKKYLVIDTFLTQQERSAGMQYE